MRSPTRARADLCVDLVSRSSPASWAILLRRHLTTLRLRRRSFSRFVLLKPFLRSQQLIKSFLQHVPRFAMPQLCSRHSLPSSLFRSSLFASVGEDCALTWAFAAQFMLPSILTELDQLLLVQEFNSRVFNGRIDPALVRMALMTPSAGLEDNYERLELLGPSSLPRSVLTRTDRLSQATPSSSTSLAVSPVRLRYRPGSRKLAQSTALLRSRRAPTRETCITNA